MTHGNDRRTRYGGVAPPRVWSVLAVWAVPLCYGGGGVRCSMA
jgi:hypothetical protein